MRIDEHLRATRQVYDREAHDYACKTGSYESFPGLQNEIDRFRRRAMTALPLLDLGCGVGRDTEYLLSQGCAVVAADLSSEMLKITRERCCNQKTLMLVQLTMTELPFKDGMIGGAWVCASLLHLPNDHFAPALNELLRVLSPGGSVAISMKAGNSEGWHSGSSLPHPRWFTLVDPSHFAKLLRSWNKITN